MEPHSHDWRLMWERTNENLRVDGKWRLATVRRWYCTACRRVEVTADPQTGLITVANDYNDFQAGVS